MICSVNYFLFFHIFTYLGVSCIVNIQEYFHGKFLDITIFKFHYIHRRRLLNWLGNLIQSDQSGERVSLMPGSQTWLILRSWGVMQCVCGGSLTHTPSAGGHLWSQQWEDQRCWPQHSRTDVCTAHYTCSSSLLHPSSLHTQTHTTISAHHMHAASLASVIIQSRNVSFYQS